MQWFGERAFLNPGNDNWIIAQRALVLLDLLLMSIRSWFKLTVCEHINGVERLKSMSVKTEDNKYRFQSKWN